MYNEWIIHTFWIICRIIWQITYECKPAGAAIDQASSTDRQVRAEQLQFPRRPSLLARTPTHLTMAKVAPGTLDMERWDPVVLEMDFMYRMPQSMYCCPSVCACCGCCPGLILGCPWCCCVLPDHTLQKTMDWAANNDKLGAGKNFVDYKFTHYEDGSGFKATEIFRNADAATEYYASFVKPGPLLCENITLTCRLKNGPVTVTGNPEEIAKSKQLCVAPGRTAHGTSGTSHMSGYFEWGSRSNRMFAQRAIQQDQGRRRQEGERADAVDRGAHSCVARRTVWRLPLWLEGKGQRGAGGEVRGPSEAPARRFARGRRRGVVRAEPGGCCRDTYGLEALALENLLDVVRGSIVEFISLANSIRTAPAPPKGDVVRVLCASWGV